MKLIAVAVLYAALLCAQNGVMDAHASEEQLHEKGTVRRTKKKGVTKIQKKVKGSTSMEAVVDVAIIGAGFGGLHIADALLHDPLEENKERDDSSNRPTVIILEEKATVGGRAIDIKFDAAPDVWVGMGPWRIIFDQFLGHRLIKRFGLETIPFSIDRGSNSMTARGMRSTNRTKIADERFFTSDPSKGFIDFITEALVVASTTDRYDHSAGHKSFITDLFGGEGWEQYKLNFHTFRGDYDLFSVWEELVAAGRRSFFLSGEDRINAVQSIVGGWSVLAKALAAEIESNEKATLQLETEVTSVDYNLKDDVYVLTANDKNGQLNIFAKKVVFSVPKSAMAKIKGSIGEAIQSTDGYKSVAPYPVAKAAAVWEDKWWEPILGDDDDDGIYNQAQGFSECFRMIPYNFDSNYTANVVHTAYTGEECAYLIDRLSKLPKEVADAELIRHLERMFPDFKGNIPMPLESAYIFHDGGWHFNHARTMTHEQTHEWALDPLGGIHKGRVMMVAEAWARARGWVEAAFDVGADALERNFNMTIRPNVPGFVEGSRDYWPAKQPFEVNWPSKYFGDDRRKTKETLTFRQLKETLEDPNVKKQLVDIIEFANTL